MKMKNNKGFSLVELIVVIAIMAILAAVAVIGVSVYIPKAQKAADEQMVSDIEEALLLAYYSGELTESGYVVLTMNAAANPSDDAVRDTLLAAYGNLDELKLTHDGWSEGGDFGKYASSVEGSFVTNGTDDLLKDVDNCAGKLAEFMVEIGGDLFSGMEGANALDGLLQADGVVSGMLGGYDPTDIDQTVLANATVFGLASSLTNSENANTVVEGFKGTILEDEVVSSGNPNMLTQTAHKYAAMEAFVTYVNCDCVRSVLQEFNNNGMNSDNPTTIVDNLNAASFNMLVAAADCPNGCEAKYREYYGLDVDGFPDPNVTKSPAQKDGEAYVATMQAVNSLSGNYAASLGNSGMFTDGTVGKDLDTYLNLASAIPSEGSYYVVSFRIDETGIIFD